MPEVLDRKDKSECKHGFTNRGCLHCAILKALHGFPKKRALKLRNMEFFLQNVQNEIFKIFKVFKNSMKFSRAACWINSIKINRCKSTILIIFLFCHYCWSLLWCNFWKSLKSVLPFHKKIVLFASIKVV